MFTCTSQENRLLLLLYMLSRSTSYKQVSFLTVLIKEMCCFKKLDTSIRCTQTKSELNYETFLSQVVSERKVSQFSSSNYKVLSAGEKKARKCSTAFMKGKQKKYGVSGKDYPSAVKAREMEHLQQEEEMLRWNHMSIFTFFPLKFSIFQEHCCATYCLFCSSTTGRKSSRKERSERKAAKVLCSALSESCYRFPLLLTIQALVFGH